jgi:large subunit ribosomal protein L31e
MVERTYNIPLRKEFNKVPSYKKTSKAVKATRNFLQKHMKVDVVKLGRHLNQELHKNGRKNPPHHIKVKVWTETVKIKDKDVNICKAEWINAPAEPQIKVEDKKTQDIKVTNKKDQKLEEKIKKEDAEKKEVLEHHAPKQETKKAKKETEGKQKGAEEKVKSMKKDFPHDQKPTHEKKK